MKERKDIHQERDPAAVRAVVARIAADYTLHAIDGLQRVSVGVDDEALHDFRVGIRRLRSVMRAYRDCFEDPQFADRFIKKLGKIARMSNEARDIEVHIDLIKKYRKQLIGTYGVVPPSRLAPMLHDYERQKSEHYARIRNELPAKRIERWMRKKYGKLFGEELHNKAPCRELSGEFCEALRQRAAVFASDLQHALDQVTSIEDVEESHKARIAGKRLRYLIEPHCNEIDGTEGLVKQLKNLQDLLGDLHDITLLVERLRTYKDKSSAGLERFSEVMHREIFASFQAAWIGKNKEKFLAQLQRW